MTTEPLRIAVLEGDQTGQELLEQSLRILDSALLGLPLELVRFDLSLAERRRTNNDVVTQASAFMRRHGFGLKAATITPTQAGDVGSPNQRLREHVDGTVIVRTGRPLPGVTPRLPGLEHPITVMRMATGDAYGAEEQRRTVDGQEEALRTERITRPQCRDVAEQAFLLAAQTGAKVYGGPKWTVSPVYEGMLKEEMDRVAAGYPNVPYEPMLIDATYAGLIGGAVTDMPVVVPALNRDGDCLTDLVLPMFGSIAGAESVLLSVDEDGQPSVVMAEAPHGTAPTLEGKNVANPLAMLLAIGALLRYAAASVPAAAQASDRVYAAALGVTAAGVRTGDLGGVASTSGVVDAVIDHLAT